MEGPCEPNELQVDFKRLDRAGRVRIQLKWPGGCFVDTLDVLKASARAKCIAQIQLQHPGLDRTELEGVLASVAQKTVEASIDSETESDESGSFTNDSDDQILIGIGRDPALCELFHTGSKHDATPYARVRVDEHWENWQLGSQAFGNWIRHQFFTRHSRSPSAQGFTSAIGTLSAAALFEGESMRVYVRIALLAEMTVIDLGDEAWRVIVITSAGWKVAAGDDVPVRFTRKRGMAALPEPKRRGDLEPLRRFLNARTDDLWILLACTLVVLLRGRGPFVVLLFLGEQGSAKSSSAKKMRSLIDPSLVPVRRLPKCERDLMISASGSYILSFDNVSSIPQEMSDALCSIATGGGFGTRELYRNDEEQIFEAMRPVVINGIGDVATRPDLLDRALILNLPRIPKKERRPERVLDAEFEALRPSLFGALLDAVSRSMRLESELELEDVPRMADFALQGAAAEAALGFPKGSFTDAYGRNRAEAVLVALESAPIYPALRAFLDARDEWQGTCQELLTHLEFAGTKDARTWPRSAKGLSDALKRIAPALRTIGIDVEFPARKAGGNRDRQVRLQLHRDRNEQPADGDGASDDADAQEGEQARDGRDGWDTRFGERSVPIPRTDEIPTTIPSDLSRKGPSQPSRPSHRPATEESGEFATQQQLGAPFDASDVYHDEEGGR